MKTEALVWAKDESGNRHLCPTDEIKSTNFVGSDEIDKCIDHDTRLNSRRNVPSNDPEGKVKFSKSFSPN
jgi:hypothetical protein